MTTIRVAYLGPAGTYSHQAARQQFEPYALTDDSVSVMYLPQESIAGCFRAIGEGQCDYSIIPFENSSNGQVVLSYDLFRDWYVSRNHGPSPTFQVVAEQFVAIHHHLICYGSDLSQIDTIYSHRQVWSQCNKFLDELDALCDHSVARLDVNSTSQAVATLASIQSRKEQRRCAAIASATASEIHGVPIRRTNIEDLSGNTTRFLVLGNPQTEIPGAQYARMSQKKLTLLTFIIKDNDNFGSLCDILEVFKRYNLNLQSITTRPSVVSPWRYVFFVEVWYGNQLDRAMEDISPKVLNLTVIGTFPRSEKFFKMVGQGQ